HHHHAGQIPSGGMTANIEPAWVSSETFRIVICPGNGRTVLANDLIQSDLGREREIWDYKVDSTGNKGFSDIAAIILMALCPGTTMMVDLNRSP
ncbi:MAG: hypothetical protein QGG48_03175, partial [Desulfatiglandales bacterium]|nr:hypothetical protein [Desulfatiglandales bacterium]